MCTKLRSTRPAATLATVRQRAQTSRMGESRASAVRGLASLAALVLGVACEPPRAPERALPAYEGSALVAFDDGIEPASVGLALEAKGAPSTDARLRERVQTSDATVRVRVQTVTEKHEDRGTSYVLGLRRDEILGGSFPPPETLQVHVGVDSPAHGVVASFESRLVGHSFLATVRQFAPGGAARGTREAIGASESGDDRAEERDLHFHFYTDDARTAEAVKSAYALASFR